MPDEAPPPVAPARARVLILTEPAGTWPVALQARLKNPTPFLIHESPALAQSLDAIDDQLKSAGDVDEVILSVGAAESRAKADPEVIRRTVEKLIYRVVLYQPGSRPAPRVTLVAPVPELVTIYRELALGLDTRFVDASVDAQPDALAARIAEAFTPTSPPPEPPSDVKVVGAKVTWQPSPTPTVIGYEIRDAEEDGTLLTTSVTTEATLPEGHDACLVRARDGAARTSKGIRSEAR